MRVVIADDEPLVRFSLRSMMDELNLGLKVVAEAADGDDLVSQATSHQPDLCIVDVRMPGLNGLAAIRRLRAAGSHARWVILTSHAEFEYASEAIRMGASAYILKPAGPVDLEKALAPLVGQWRDERWEACRQFERSLLAGETPDVEAGWVLLLRMDASASSSQKERSSFGPSTVRAVQQLVKAFVAGTLRVATLQTSADEIVVTAAWSALDRFSRAESLRLREQLSVLVRASSGTSLVLTCFAGEECHSWQQMLSSRDELEAASVQRVVLGTAAVYDLATLKRRLAGLPAGLRELGGLVEDFLVARLRGEAPDLSTKAELIAKAFSELGGSSFLECTARFLAFRTGGSPPAEDLARWAQEFLDASALEIPMVRRSADGQTRVVEKVDTFLQANLSLEIRVPDIAAALGLSPNYLSSVYHRLTNGTISGRLTNLRLERARQLLSRPGCQVKEVAAEVGYRSTRHFAHLYHAYFGQYPSGRKS